MALRGGAPRVVVRVRVRVRIRVRVSVNLERQGFDLVAIKFGMSVKGRG